MNTNPVFYASKMKRVKLLLSFFFFSYYCDNTDNHDNSANDHHAMKRWYRFIKWTHAQPNDAWCQRFLPNAPFCKDNMAHFWWAMTWNNMFILAVVAVHFASRVQNSAWAAAFHCDAFQVDTTVSNNHHNVLIIRRWCGIFPKAEFLPGWFLFT